MLALVYACVGKYLTKLAQCMQVRSEVIAILRAGMRGETNKRQPDRVTRRGAGNLIGLVNHSNVHPTLRQRVRGGTTGESGTNN